MLKWRNRSAVRTRVPPVSVRKLLTMDDVKLILLVQNKECLFNLCHKNYSEDMEGNW
jgi:hypothetical protein